LTPPAKSRNADPINKAVKGSRLLTINSSSHFVVGRRPHLMKQQYPIEKSTLLEIKRISPSMVLFCSL
jgi:hypothetical protein